MYVYVGVSFQVFFSVVIGAFALGNAAPQLENFGTAQGAAYALWEIMDTVSQRLFYYWR